MSGGQNAAQFNNILSTTLLSKTDVVIEVKACVTFDIFGSFNGGAIDKTLLVGKIESVVFLTIKAGAKQKIINQTQCTILRVHR